MPLPPYWSRRFATLAQHLHYSDRFPLAMAVQDIEDALGDSPAPLVSLTDSRVPQEAAEFISYLEEKAGGWHGPPPD